MKVKVKSLSRVQLFATPWTVAYQVPPSVGFSRQEYWSGLPFPSPGDLPDPGAEPGSPALQVDALPSESQHIKKQRYYFANKGPSSQSSGFSSSHVWMWELDHKESWGLKKWCFQIGVLEKTLESPLDCKEIKPVTPKGNPEYSLEGLMLKLKHQYSGHLMRRTDSQEKTLVLGKI